MKKMLILILAVILVFAFATTAFAYTISTDKTFSAGTCYNQFTTSRYITKQTAGDWYQFYCRATMSWPSGDSGWTKHLYATPKTSSGYAMANTIDVPYSTTTGYGQYATSYKSTYNSYYLIQNPHSGYNMPCEGHFWGHSA